MKQQIEGRQTKCPMETDHMQSPRKMGGGRKAREL